MKTLYALGALAIGATSAHAADLIVDPVVYTEPATYSSFDWSGFYAGIHGGYGWGTQTDDQSDLFEEITVSDTVLDEFDIDGFIGGVHAGANMQMGQFVLGVEGDVDWTSIGGSFDGSYDGGFYQRTLEQTSNWQASLRARGGIVMDERTLLYGTAGVAWAEGELSVTGFNGETPITPSTDTQTHLGWTVGIGAEHAFTDSVLGRAELRYTSFGDETYATTDGPVDSGWDQLTATVGVSFKF